MLELCQTKMTLSPTPYRLVLINKYSQSFNFERNVDNNYSVEPFMSRCQ